jgi:hypothetical protein
MYLNLFHVNEVLDQFHSNPLILVYHKFYELLEMIILMVLNILHKSHLLD